MDFSTNRTETMKNLQEEFDQIKTGRRNKSAVGLHPPPMPGLSFTSKHSITPHPGFQEACLLSEKMKYDSSTKKQPMKPVAGPSSFKLSDDVMFTNLTAFLTQSPSYLRIDDLERAKNVACQVLSKGPSASLPLLQLAHDVLYNVIETGASFQADQFLNSLLLTFVSMQYLKVNAPQSSIEDRASRMSHRAFQRRSSNKYLATATAADTRSADPSLELLKRECQKSLVDLIFKIRMRQVVALVQEGPKPGMSKMNMSTRENARPQVHSQPRLHCRIPRIPQTPRVPQKPAVGGFWTTDA